VIPGYSAINYSCFHFHPSVLTNYTEAYLLIKNNLTFIYPLKLVGSSGLGDLKLANITTLSINNYDEKFESDAQPLESSNENSIFFDLNMNHDLFKVKAFEKLTKEEISQKLRTSILANESLTVKDLSLIRSHKKVFCISNVGDFPVDIQSVSISDHGTEFNGFSITNSSGKYEINFEPDFKNSKVTEKLLVMTKYSVKEFTLQAYIPIYIIKFIDNNFRITELEESIGNWYYLIIFVFTLLTVVLFGTELLEYANHMKNRSKNIEIIQDMYMQHKEESTGKNESKAISIQNFMNANLDKFASVHEKVFECYANAAVYYNSNLMAKEVKKLLTTKFEFDHDSRSSSVSIKSNKQRYNVKDVQHKLNEALLNKSVENSLRKEGKTKNPKHVKTVKSPIQQSPSESQPSGSQPKTKKKELVIGKQKGPEVIEDIVKPDDKPTLDKPLDNKPEGQKVNEPKQKKGK